MPDEDRVAIEIVFVQETNNLEERQNYASMHVNSMKCYGQTKSIFTSIILILGNFS